MILNKYCYLLFSLLLASASSSLSMCKLQKTVDIPAHTQLYNAILDNNYEHIKKALASQKHAFTFFLSYESLLGMLKLELLINEDANSDHYVSKRTIYFEHEKYLLPKIRCLLIHNIGVSLEEFDEDNNMTWEILSPTLAKYLMIEPTDPKAYDEDPEQYLIDYPNDFDPVTRYPKDFDEEIMKQEQFKLNKLINQYGSMANYLRIRELGIKQ